MGFSQDAVSGYELGKPTFGFITEFQVSVSDKADLFFQAGVCDKQNLWDVQLIYGLRPYKEERERRIEPGLYANYLVRNHYLGLVIDKDFYLFHFKDDEINLGANAGMEGGINFVDAFGFRYNEPSYAWYAPKASVILAIGDAFFMKLGYKYEKFYSPEGPKHSGFLSLGFKL